MKYTLNAIQEKLDTLNTRNGTPLETYSRNANGEYISNAGNYHIGRAYGSTKIQQICGNGSGVKEVIAFGTKREVYLKLCKYMLTN